MTRLEDLKPGAAVKGILPEALVTIESVKWHGSVLEVTYKGAHGWLGSPRLRPPRCQLRGYDVESRVPGTGKLRFIEVKGRVAGATTVTITKNEILTGLNKPEDFILAIVEVDRDSVTPRYVRQPFQREPDFAVTSVNYALRELASRAQAPA